MQTVYVYDLELLCLPIIALIGIKFKLPLEI